MRTLKFVRNIIKELDKETGLDGASLELKRNKTTRQLGCFTFSKITYRNGGGTTYTPKSFTFSEVVLDCDDDTIREIVKHEYAHYMALVTYNDQCHHDYRFKEMCQQIGANANEPTFGNDSIRSSLVKKSKYVLTCKECGHVYTYSRNCQTLELAKAGSPLVSCSCGCHEFEVKQNY